MKKGLFILLVTGIILGCKKDTVEVLEEQEETEIRAGIYDGTYYHNEMTSPLEIQVTWDADNLYGSGMDSLDLNADGNYDLRIQLLRLNYDSIHLLTGLPNPFPSCRLFVKNGLEISFYSEGFPIGFGQTSSIDYCDTLNYGEEISSGLQWRSESELGIAMWAENPGSGTLPSFGGWYYACSTMYLGIRMSGNKYGWIEVDAADPKNPIFKSFAYQL